MLDRFGFRTSDDAKHRTDGNAREEITEHGAEAEPVRYGDRDHGGKQVDERVLKEPHQTAAGSERIASSMMSFRSGAASAFSRSSVLSRNAASRRL